MRFRLVIPSAAVAGALLLAAGAPAQTMAAQAAQRRAQAASISLFDGKSLNGWRGYKKPDAAGSPLDRPGRHADAAAR